MGVFALATLATPAFAQVADDSIVVTADRSARSTDDIGSSVTVIDSKQIAASQAQNIVDLLRTVPGVAFSRNGGPGTATQVYLRGAEADQTVALIDGVKLNDPAAPGGGFDFGSLLVGNVERIEVVRGAQSTIWGSQAIGGVVNLITAAPGEKLAVTARAEGGWRDTAQVVGNISGTVGPVAASVGAGWFRTDGVSAFNAYRGGTERDGYRQFGANAKAIVTISDAISIDLRGWYADGRTEQDGFAPPLYNFGDTREYTGKTEATGYAGVNVALLGGKFRNRIAVAYTTTDRASFDRDGGPGATFAALGTNTRFEYQGVLDLSDRIGATLGAETERSTSRTASFGGPAARADARLTSVYGQVRAKPVVGLSLTAGVRQDDHDTFGGATTVSANGVYTPNGGATQVRASYGEGFKVPSLFQLFGDYGNTTLTPERSQSWDAGVSQRLAGDRVVVGVTYFHRDTRNQIDFIGCFGNPAAICVGRPFGTYDNIRRTRAEGLEVQGVVRPADALTLTANYTFLNARNRDTGKQLARRPRDSANGSVDYLLPFGLNLGASVSYVGSRFDDGGNVNRVKGYTLLDLRASFPVTKGVEVYGRVENVGDVRYETVRTYGTAGRAAYAGVRVAL